MQLKKYLHLRVAAQYGRCLLLSLREECGFYCGDQCVVKVKVNQHGGPEVSHACQKLVLENTIPHL